MEACVSMRSTVAPPCVDGDARKSMTAAWSSVFMIVTDEAAECLDTRPPATVDATSAGGHDPSSDKRQAEGTPFRYSTYEKRPCNQASPAASSWRGSIASSWTCA